MKTSIQSFPLIPGRNVSLRELSGFVFFWVAAFLPSLLQLAMSGISVANPLAALGPLLAGFWFAASNRGTRLHFTTLGVLLTVLLWLINWLMMAEAGCCKTLG